MQLGGLSMRAWGRHARTGGSGGLARTAALGALTAVLMLSGAGVQAAWAQGNPSPAGGKSGGGGSSAKTSVMYVLAPHEDDIQSDWSLVAAHPSSYWVFVTFTQGEETGNCNGVGGYTLNTANGDYVPAGFTKSSTTATGYTNGHMGTALCATSRVDSLNHFLDAQCNIKEYSALCDHTNRMTQHTITGVVAPGDFHNPTTGDGSCTYGTPAVLPDGTSYDNCTMAPAGPPGSSSQDTLVALTKVDPSYPNGCPFNDDFVNSSVYSAAALTSEGSLFGCDTSSTWYVGKNTARVYFNLGDSNLTTDEVLWAMKTVRANRALFPVSTEAGAADPMYSAYTDPITGANSCTSSVSFDGASNWVYNNYKHTDHYAVDVVLRTFNLFGGASVPQYAWITPCQQTSTSISVTPTVSGWLAEYGVNAAEPLVAGLQPSSCTNDQHTGVGQSSFGWLDFGRLTGCVGNTGGYWPSATFEPVEFFDVLHPTATGP